MRTPRFALALILSLLVTALLLPSAHADALDDYIRAEMAARKIPGLAVGVLRDGKVVAQRAYGRASVELDAPAKLGTVYPLASMTKVFTAAGVMVLVREGRISLDDPIRKILPELPASWASVTVRHCLTHTSGLPQDTTDDINITPVAATREEFLSRLATAPIEPPGRRSVYNGTGYVLAAMAIERLTGLSYEAFIRRRVLEPAGVGGMAFGDAWTIIPRRASLYTTLDVTPDRAKLLVSNGRPVLSPSGINHYGSKVWPTWSNPAAGLNGSLLDLIQWEQALAAGTIVSPAQLQEMTHPYQLAAGAPGDFGVGFIAGKQAGRDTVSYGGGAATWRLAIPSERLTVLVLTNLQGSSPQSLAAGVAVIFAPGLKAAQSR